MFYSDCTISEPIEQNPIEYEKRIYKMVVRLASKLLTTLTFHCTYMGTALLVTGRNLLTQLHVV